MFEWQGAGPVHTRQTMVGEELQAVADMVNVSKTQLLRHREQGGIFLRVVTNCTVTGLTVGPAGQILV